MKIVETLIDEKFLKLKKMSDPENNVGAYLFAERLGVDSVAFLCVDEQDPTQFLVNEEYKPPTSEFVMGAFGGSIDKDKSLIEIVIDEVKEEAGYVVDKSKVREMGRMFVSTQMNQYCHLFLVEVDASAEQEREPENEIEAMAKTRWLSYDQVMELEEWKAIVIASRT